MKNLLLKVKEVTATVVNVTKGISFAFSRPIKAIVVSFLAILFILVMSFYAAWIFLFYHGKAVLGDLLSLIDRVISPQMVAFITFIATCFVDQDNNGIPDRFEEDKNETSNTGRVKEHRPPSTRRD